MKDDDEDEDEAEDELDRPEDFERLMFSMKSSTGLIGRDLAEAGCTACGDCPPPKNSPP